MYHTLTVSNSNKRYYKLRLSSHGRLLYVDYTGNRFVDMSRSYKRNYPRRRTLPTSRNVESKEFDLERLVLALLLSAGIVILQSKAPETIVRSETQ